MQRHFGRVIHKHRDSFGDLEVIEMGRERSLHFGTDPKQSSMDINAPERLLLGYTRAMTAALLFNHQPQRVLLVGLGGGSLAKFLLHHFPTVRIDALELRPEVHRLAREYFHLPDDERLSVHYGDAADLLRNSALPESGYDLALIDAFVDKGISRSVCGLSFYQIVRETMVDNGVVSVNLWTGDFITAEQMLENIADSFGGGALRLPVEGRDNIIGIATCAPKPRRQLRSLGDTAKQLEALTDVEMGVFLRQLRKFNRSLFGR